MKHIKLAEDRRQKIIELLAEDGSAGVKKLSMLFDVSTVSKQVSYLFVQNLVNIEKKQKLQSKP